MARFRFIEHKIVKASISFDEYKKISEDIDIEFAQSQGVNIDESKFRLILEVKIFDKNKHIDINVISHGYFEFDRDLNDDEKSMFFDVNAPAILFPYLRAYISTLTALSGLKPITLPTINLSEGAMNHNK